jgi:hypothetical protein
MKIMLLLVLAVVAGLLCQPRETKAITKAQKWVLVAVGLVSCVLGAGLAFGGHF